MMDCREVKQLLPLWVGQDLPDANSTSEVTRHLDHCPECDQRRISLQSSLDILQGAAVGGLADESSSRSLWPQLTTRISDWERFHRRERFNGWIPASVMALAVALMIAVSLPSIRDEFLGGRPRDVNVVDLFESIPEISSDGQFKVSRSGMNSMPNTHSAVGTPVDFKPDQW